MNKPLTNRQKQTLRIIIENLQTHGFPPSVREIQNSLGISSVRGAVVHLEALEKKGFIKRNGKARGITILKNLPTAGNPKAGKVKIPLIGQIAAGRPILAQENIEKYVSIKRQYLRGNEKAFLLRVKGDSMIEAGIKSGDLAIVLPTSTANNGDFVVALLGNEATLKKFHRVENYVALLPANPNYKPIIGQKFSIQGKVIGVVKESDKPYGAVASDGALLPIYKMKVRNGAKTAPPRWAYGTSANSQI